MAAAAKSEADSSISKAFSANATTFSCYRCNTKKKSRRKYRWKTSAGTKIICNSCRKFLRKQAKHTKTKETPATMVPTPIKRKATAIQEKKTAKKCQPVRNDGQMDSSSSRHTIDNIFADSNKVQYNCSKIRWWSGVESMDTFWWWVWLERGDWHIANIYVRVLFKLNFALHCVPNCNVPHFHTRSHSQMHHHIIKITDVQRRK